MRTFHSLKIPVVIFALLFSGCGGDPVKEDLQPLTDAMCRMLEAGKNILTARHAGDYNEAHKFKTEQLKIEAEITVLNQEFREKYREQIDDEEFKTKVRTTINKLLEDCPFLSAADSIPLGSADLEDSLDFH
jgi:hypothetical protein